MGFGTKQRIEGLVTAALIQCSSNFISCIYNNNNSSSPSFHYQGLTKWWSELNFHVGCLV